MAKMTCDCNVIHEDTVRRAKESQPQASELPELAELFRIIGDGTRVRILCLLNSGEMCVCDISNTLDMTKSAISHQLAVLKKHRLVTSRRAGKEIFYRLDDAHVVGLLNAGLAHIKHRNAVEEAAGKE